MEIRCRDADGRSFLQERNFNRSAYPINDLSPAPCGQVGGTVAGFTEERNPQYQPPPGGGAPAGFLVCRQPLNSLQPDHRSPGLAPLHGLERRFGVAQPDGAGDHPVEVELARFVPLRQQGGNPARAGSHRTNSPGASRPGLQLLKQKNHGLRASLRFALRPWFQNSHRKWYNYRGQVTGA